MNAENRDKMEPQVDDDQDQAGSEDTEGHVFLPPDAGTARSLAQGRAADMERHLKERRREKEAKPNRRI
jgi:hypothetical protein